MGFKQKFRLVVALTATTGFFGGYAFAVDFIPGSACSLKSGSAGAEKETSFKSSASGTSNTTVYCPTNAYNIEYGVNVYVSVTAAFSGKVNTTMQCRLVQVGIVSPYFGTGARVTLPYFDRNA